MANPLKSVLGNTPLGNMMNPEQMLMSMLQQKNPQAYQMLQQLQSSGQNPQQLLSNMTANMTPEQLAQIKQMGSQFGIR